MDLIREILLTFSDKDLKEFEKFMVRQKPHNARKDQKLLSELWKTRLDPQLIPENEKGQATYHANRKRIRRALTDFVTLKQMEQDPSHSGSVQSLITVSQHLFDYKRTDAAWKFLQKAEKMAVENQRPGILLQVYRLMATHLHEQEHYSFSQLMRLMKNTRKKLEELDSIQLATAKIRMELQAIMQTGKNIDFKEFVKKTLEEFDLSETQKREPVFLLNIVEISRSTYLAMRDLRNFESFILAYYPELSKALGKHEGKYSKECVKLEYMTAHVLLRNRKFSDAEKHLLLMEKHMLMSAATYKANIGKQIGLKSVLLSLSGRNNQAIEEVSALLKEKGNLLDVADKLNTELNLTFYYFNAGEFGKANKILLYMTHSNIWYAKKMGVEWVLRKEMIRAIVQYELGNEDVAMRIVQSLQKNYGFLLKNLMYRKAEWFLSMLLNYMENPFALNYAEFAENASKNMFVIPTEEEESKSLAFYSWMKAKLLNKNYYEVMLGEVNF